MVHSILTPKPAENVSADKSAFDSERERLHRQMLSSVSHDLKTPLASIIGALEVFERMKDKLSIEKQSTLVNVALEEAYRLDNFITNILDMARLENKMVKTNYESIEINATISNCLLRINNRLKGIQVDFNKSAPLETSTDPVLLSRAICLVLDNAVKYGGKPPLITIECGQEKPHFGFVRIRDNGEGIPMSGIETIFSKYTRFVKEDQQNAGTGLGLSISRAIMKLLGGEIIASNHPGGGALLTLEFPIP